VILEVVLEALVRNCLCLSCCITDVLTETHTPAQTSAGTVQDELRRLTKSLELSNQAIDCLQDTIVQQHSKNIQLAIDLGKARNECHSANSALTKTQAELQDLEPKYREMQSRMQSLFDQRVRAKDDEITRANKQYNDMKGCCELAENEVAVVHAEVENLRSELEKSKEARIQQHFKLRSTERDRDEAKRQLAETKGKLNVAKLMSECHLELRRKATAEIVQLEQELARVKAGLTENKFDTMSNV
jgi:chromosome segregation ATPase